MSMCKYVLCLVVLGIAMLKGRLVNGGLLERGNDSQKRSKVKVKGYTAHY